MKLVRISKEGSMDEVTEKLTVNNILKKLKKICNSQGNNDITLLYKWQYDNNTLECYGWYDGEDGFENKHDLPPCGKSQFLETDSSDQLLFGDIFIIKMDKSNKKYLDMTISEYCDFYNFAFGGFDYCGSEDDDDIKNEHSDEEGLDECIPNIESDEECEVDGGNSSEEEVEDLGLDITNYT